MKTTLHQMAVVRAKIEDRLAAEHPAWLSFDGFTKERLIRQHALSVIAEAAFQTACIDWDEGQSPWPTFDQTLEAELDNLVNIDKHA